MREKRMHLCNSCIDLISETQKVAQFHAYRNEKGKCEWCKKERELYWIIVGGDGDAFRDHSYAKPEIP